MNYSGHDLVYSGHDLESYPELGDLGYSGHDLVYSGHDLESYPELDDLGYSGHDLESYPELVTWDTQGTTWSRTLS